MPTPNWMSPRFDLGIIGPNDWIIEPFASAGDANETITLLTDTTYVSHAKFIAPVPDDATPTAVSVLTVGSSGAYNGENVAHRVYIFGGNGSGGQGAILESVSNRHPRPGCLYWDIVPAAAASGNVRTLTADDYGMVKLEVVIPISEVTAAGTANARSTGVDDIVAATATVSTAGATDSVGALIGGYIDNFVSTNETNRAFILPAAELGKVKPGDLVMEVVVTAALNAASPAVATITASTDCTFIDVIRAVIPFDISATARSCAAVVATGGATVTIYGANGITDTVRCLVIGYAL